MVYKRWPHIFNTDATPTTTIFDRLVHHCETVTIVGKSYRTKVEASLAEALSRWPYKAPSHRRPHCVSPPLR
jgi:hypothetical protein